MLIEKIIDTDLGLTLDAKDILDLSEEFGFTLRRKINNKIAEGRPRYLCAVCEKIVKIKGSITGGKKAGLHFAHSYSKEEDRCPLTKDTRGKDRKTKKMILAAQFQGQDESEAHILLKNKISYLLETDPRTEFVHQEKVIKDKSNNKKWRRPDVYCKWEGKEIVFEIQLSRTFESTIRERENFYKNNKIYIIWVCANFLKEYYYLKDIYYNNKNNMLTMHPTLDDEFTCFYMDYKMKGNLIHPDKWRSEMCTLDDLTFCQETYKAFLVDTARNRDLLEKSRDGVRETPD